MSIINNYDIKNVFSHLEDNIKTLKLLDDLLTFLVITYDSIKLLSSILQKIRNKNNSYGKNIPIELQANIISFLPYEYKLICCRVCKTWLGNLNNNLSKKVLPLLKHINFSKVFNLNFEPKIMMNIENNIYISNKSNACKFDIKNTKFIEINDMNLKEDRICSNEKYICVIKSFDAHIFSSNMEFINNIKIGLVQSLAIDDNDNILVSSIDRFSIYNIKGNIIKSWTLANNSDIIIKARKIFPYKDEIYMVDTSFDRVCVFSYDGKLNRFWGNYGEDPGNFISPWGIAIYKNIVFIVDFGNRRIQAFTCYGKFICEYKFENNIKYMNIVIKDNHIYLTSWRSTNMLRLKLVFD
jgi:F-box domain.